MARNKDKDVDIGHIDVRNQRLIIKVRTWKGKSSLDVRYYYEDAEGNWKPTKKGVSLPIVDEVPEDFFALLNKAAAYIEKEDI
jgi:hypothetical protein